MSKDSTCNIIVAVRVKPHDEKGDIPALSESPNDSNTIIVSKGGTAKHYSFDTVLWQDANQERVYEAVGKNMVENSVEGFDCCVFCYGQTGSGKTHTMIGPDGGALEPTNSSNGEQHNKDELDFSANEGGLIPRICAELLKRAPPGGAVALVSKEGSNVTAYNTYKVTFIEIYLERVRDLLSDNSSPLKLREHPVTGPFVEGTRNVNVTCFEDLRTLLLEGIARRITSQTDGNEESSRSHAIFTLEVSTATIDEETGCTFKVNRRVHLVDLAGSENAKSGKNTATQVKEGSHINKSLLALGRVIKSLVDGGRSGSGSSEFTAPDPAQSTASTSSRRHLSITTTPRSERGASSKRKSAGGAIGGGLPSTTFSRKFSSDSLFSEADTAEPSPPVLNGSKPVSGSPRSGSQGSTKLPGFGFSYSRVSTGSDQSSDPSVSVPDSVGARSTPSSPTHRRPPLTPSSNGTSVGGNSVATSVKNGHANSANIIPYRDSVLTFLLKESLGGNSHTTMLATVSPGSKHVEETLRTLRYADRAKSIVNTASVREDVVARTLQHLREQVEMLKHQLAIAQTSNTLSGSPFPLPSCDVSDAPVGLFYSDEDQIDLARRALATAAAGIAVDLGLKTVLKRSMKRMRTVSTQTAPPLVVDGSTCTVDDDVLPEPLYFMPGSLWAAQSQNQPQHDLLQRKQDEDRQKCRECSVHNYSANDYHERRDHCGSLCGHMLMRRACGNGSAGNWCRRWMELREDSVELVCFCKNDVHVQYCMCLSGALVEDAPEAAMTYKAQATGRIGQLILRVEVEEQDRPSEAWFIMLTSAHEKRRWAAAISEAARPSSDMHSHIDSVNSAIFTCGVQ